MKKYFSLGWIISLMIWAIGVTACDAQSVNGKVVKVSDGDTFTLLKPDNTTVRIRLYGIDAPETKGGQPFSRASKDFLSSMIAGQEVSVVVMDTDKYGRYIGIVSTSEVPDVNLEMLRAGMAWHYRYYDMTPDYINAEQNAKKNKTGLWKDNNPVNPYEWRQKN